VTDHGLTKLDNDSLSPRSNGDAVSRAPSFHRMPQTPPACHFCRRPASAFLRLSTLRPGRQRRRKDQVYGNLRQPHHSP
jgi:hypothetical protein